MKIGTVDRFAGMNFTCYNHWFVRTSERNIMEKEVDDTAYCAVCFEAYEETGENIPRLLPCGHSLCNGCVKRLLQRQTLNRFMQRQTLCCPQCRQDNEVPNGAVNFPQNRYILKNIKETRNEGYFQVCKKHGREMSLFCNGGLFSGWKECKTEICSLCLTKDHHNHKVVDLLGKKKDKIKSLSTDIEELIDDLNYTKVKLMETKKEVEEKFRRDAKIFSTCELPEFVRVQIIPHKKYGC